MAVYVDGELHNLTDSRRTWCRSHLPDVGAPVDREPSAGLVASRCTTPVDADDVPVFGCTVVAVVRAAALAAPDPGVGERVHPDAG